MAFQENGKVNKAFNLTKCQSILWLCRCAETVLIRDVFRVAPDKQHRELFFSKQKMLIVYSTNRKQTSEGFEIRESRKIKKRNNFHKKPDLPQVHLTVNPTQSLKNLPVFLGEMK